jgi:hypothetical protein
VSNVLDSRPSDLTARWGTGVDVEITVTVTDADGAPLEGVTPAIYLGGPANAVEPLDDAEADFTGTGGTDGVWTIAVPGQDSGSHRLRVTLDDEVVAVGFAEVGALGSRAPTTSLTIAGGSVNLALSVAAVVGGGGGGTVDTVARAAAAAAQDDIDDHAGLTTTAHGGIVASTDPRLTDARTPTTHSHPVGQIGTGTPAAGTYVDGATGAWTAIPSGGSVAWGDLTGTLSAQTDLQDALDDKANTADLGTAAAANTGDFDPAGAAAAVTTTSIGAVPTSRTLAGLDLTTNRSASDLRGALGTGTPGSGNYLRGDGTWATPSGSSFPQLPRTSGTYYSLSGSENNTQTIGSLTSSGKLLSHPVWLAAGSYDRVAIYQQGTNTATWRFGVYPANASTLLPDGETLILDAGTLNMSSTTGLRGLTVSLTIPTTGIYYLAVLVDAYTSNPTVTGWNGNAGQTPNLPWLGHTTYGSAVAGRGTWARSASSVTTGSMPSTYPSSVGADQIVQIQVRAA